MEGKKEAPATPKYGSYDGLRNPQDYRWPYRWQPTVAMVVQAIACIGAGYVAYELYDFQWWMALGIAAAVGLMLGVGYNMLARNCGWQKLHWIDIVLGSDPMVIP